MAKNRPVSKHSRAARRATSPSIDTDKSLKDVKPPSRSSSSANRPSVLAAHHSAGIQKKAKRGRKSQLSAKAKRRQERGLDMAEAVADRTSTKLQRSFGRSRVVNDRRKAWDEINSKLAHGVEGADADKDEDGLADSKDWGTDEDASDMDGDEKIEDSVADASGEKPAEDSAQNDSGFLPVDVDGDEIL